MEGSVINSLCSYYLKHDYWFVFIVNKKAADSHLHFFFLFSIVSLNQHQIFHLCHSITQSSTLIVWTSGTKGVCPRPLHCQPHTGSFTSRQNYLVYSIYYFSWAVTSIHCLHPLIHAGSQGGEFLSDSHADTVLKVLTHGVSVQMHTPCFR